MAIAAHNLASVSFQKRGGMFHVMIGAQSVIGRHLTIAAREAAALHFGCPQSEVEMQPVAGHHQLRAVRHP